MKKITRHIPALGTAVLTIALSSCGFSGNKEMAEQLQIFPDYTDITIPCNIAPLNFGIDGAKSIKVTVKGTKSYRFKSSDNILMFKQGKWKRMLKNEREQVLQVVVTAKGRQGGKKNLGFSWTVKSDSIDRYLSYSLVDPTYQASQHMQVIERDLQSFKTRCIGDNSLTDNGSINSHTQNKNGASFMHIRGGSGAGTIVNRNGRTVKISTATSSTIAPGMYGDISPDGRYGVFAAGNQAVAIHADYTKRAELYDSESDLILIDFDNMTLTDAPSVKNPYYLDTYPCFAADRNVILFCRAANLPQPDSITSVLYNICSVEYNPETGKVGDRIYTVISGQRHDASFSQLKVSPDGNFLLATAAAYGTAPEWHSESELWMIDLSNGKINPLKKVNSSAADTYHSWSSNSRWITFESKRDDNVYGRPFISYIDKDGEGTKPFVVPQKNPYMYKTSLKSFSTPELYTAAENYNSRQVMKLYRKGTSQPVQYNSLD